MTEFADADTLGLARGWLRDNLDRGERCPCCTQRAQVYRRAITSAMARSLIQCFRVAGVNTPFHMPSVLSDRLSYGGDAAKLAYWLLITEEPSLRDDGGRAGWWQVTNSGMLFATNRMTLPKYARVYDGKCLGFAGDEVSIVACLGKQFNLIALLEGRQ